MYATSFRRTNLGDIGNALLVGFLIEGTPGGNAAGVVEWSILLFCGG